MQLHIDNKTEKKIIFMRMFQKIQTYIATYVFSKQTTE